MMKKYLSFLMLAALFSFTACDVETDEEPGGTSVEKMAGFWMVTVDAVDEAGAVLGEDFFGMGRIQVNTYNTAANSATEMWIDDQGNFWNFKLKVNVDYPNRTFTTNGAKDNTSYEDCQVTIDGGKILEGAGLTPSGMPADSIVFYISFSDDTYPQEYGFAKYKVSGFRYTGFEADM